MCAPRLHSVFFLLTPRYSRFTVPHTYCNISQLHIHWQRSTNTLTRCHDFHWVSDLNGNFTSLLLNQLKQNFITELLAKIFSLSLHRTSAISLEVWITRRRPSSLLKFEPSFNSNTTGFLFGTPDTERKNYRGFLILGSNYVRANHYGLLSRAIEHSSDCNLKGDIILRGTFTCHSPLCFTYQKATSEISSFFPDVNFVS